MIRNLLINAVLLLFLTNNLFALQQMGRIVGDVHDKDTNEHLPGVNVFLEGTDLGAASSSQGEYDIKNVPPGRYTLNASMVGYQLEKKVVVVKARETIHLDIFLEIAPFMGNELVITATRTPKVIKDVPIRTEIISLERIKQKQAVNIYEALESEPGIRVENQCMNCNFTSLRVEGLPSGYTQVLMDSEPIYTGLAGVYGLQQIQTGNIERIEIVKGSGSALYGSDAIGGVVNVIMREPELLPRLNISSSVGEFGTNHFTANGSMRRGNIGLVFSLQKDLGNYIDQTGGEGPTFDDTGADGMTDRVETDNFGAVGNIFFYDVLGSNSKIKIFGRAMNEMRRGGFIEKLYTDPFHPDCEQIRTERYETGIGFEKEFLMGNKIDFNYSYVDHDRSATNGAAWDKAIGAGMLDDDLNLTNQGQSYLDQYGFNTFQNDWYPKPFIVHEKLHLADFRYSQEFLGSHMFLAGAQFRRSELDQNINGDVSDKFANDFGMYIQGDFNVTDNVELVTGVRYDKHKSEDHLTGGKYDTNTLNPRIALRYSPVNDLAIRATVGTGYRVPYVFAEDLHLCASAPKIFKGADLEPEKSVSFSFGTDYYKSNYRLGLSLFRTTINDKLEFVGAEEGEVPSGFDYQWVNFGKAYTQGVEAVFAGVTMNNEIDYNFNISYIDAKFNEKRFTAADYPDASWVENSDKIPRSPNWTGNASLTYKPDRWQFFLGINYTGSMFIDHYPEEDEAQLVVEETDPFFIVNPKITFKACDRLDLFIGAKNLLDYTQKRRDITDAAYIYAPLHGRIVYTGFNLSIR